MFSCINRCKFFSKISKFILSMFHQQHSLFFVVDFSFSLLSFSRFWHLILCGKFLFYNTIHIFWKTSLFTLIFLEFHYVIVITIPISTWNIIFKTRIIYLDNRKHMRTTAATTTTVAIVIFPLLSICDVGVYFPLFCT